MNTRPQSGNKGRLTRRTAVNIMLYIGVLAMAALSYYDYRERNAQTPVHQAFDADAVTRVTIHRPGHQTLVVVKDNDNWSIESPIHRNAQNARIDALLAIAAVDVADSYDINEFNLGEPGLDAPQATITLATATDTLQILLGGKGPHQQRRYVQIGERVWLVDDIFLPLVQGGLNAFVDLQLLPDGTTLTALKRGDVAIAADEQLQRWTTTKALGISPLVNETLAETTELTLHLSNSGNTSTQKWLLGRAQNNWTLRAAEADFVFLFSESQVRSLGLIGTP